MKAKSFLHRIGRSLAQTSPVRLLLLICVTILVTHSIAMLVIHRHAGVPPWIQSVGESVLLVVVLFPALYFFSFRPLIAQSAERLEAEANMRESEHKYRQLFDALHEAVFVIDEKSGRVIDTNRQAETLLARPRPEIVGANLAALFASASERVVLEELRAVAADLAKSGCILRLPRADGPSLPIHASASPIELYGRPFMLVLMHERNEHRAREGGRTLSADQIVAEVARWPGAEVADLIARLERLRSGRET
jgi:PAS domain S-box-containing protein